MKELVITDSLSSYLTFIRDIPSLSIEEELELGNRVHHDEDLEAARKMILSHLRFVVFIAKKYISYGLPLEDLIQEGNIGLMKAVGKFDPSKSVRLATFAVYHIKNEIHEYIIRNWGIVKIATTKAQRKLFFNLRSMKADTGHSTEEEREAIAKELNVSVKEVRTMEERMYASHPSFDPVGTDDDEFVSSPSGFLYDENSDPALQLEEEEYQARVKGKVMDFIDDLDDRDRDIILSRKFMETPLSLKELADKYGVSIERIRQLEERIVDNLTKMVGEL